ncbi:hypothetical protein QQ045_015536 [Rhodiola kirilowii]
MQKETGSKSQDHEKLIGIGGPYSAMVDRVVCPTEKKHSTGSTGQDESQSPSGKYLSTLKRVRKREAKAKKDIRYQRRNSLRIAENVLISEEETNSNQQSIKQSQKERCGADMGDQEERSSDHFDITLSAFKMIKKET